MGWPTWSWRQMTAVRARMPKSIFRWPPLAP